MMPFSLRWRALEWWGAGIAIFLQTGALFPLILTSSEGMGDARGLLRMLVLPSYAITAVLLARRPRALVMAARRSFVLTLLLTLPFLSVLWSESGSVTLRRAIALFFSMALAYLLAIRFSPRELMALCAAVLVPCMVLSLIFFVFLPHLGEMPAGPGPSGARGIFTHKNILGRYAAVAVIVTAAMVSGAPSPRRYLYLGMLGVSLACLVLSTSLTGMICVASGLIFALFYWLLLKIHGLGRVVHVLLAIQFAALVLVLMGYFLVPVLESLGKDATLSGRIPLWHLVDREIGKRLLLGYGYQAFWEASPAAWRIWAEIGWDAPHSHNGFRELLLNFGLVGFVLFTVAAIRAFWQGARLVCHAPRGGWLWLNVYFGAVLTVNFTETLLMNQNDFFFMIFATSMVMFSIHAGAIPKTRPVASRPRSMPDTAADPRPPWLPGVGPAAAH